MSGYRLRAPIVKLSENDVRAACLQVLRLRGWWPIRQHVIKTRTPDGRWVSIGEKGDPDYCITRAPGFFLETKAPGGELSRAQIERIAELKILSGMDTVVVAGVEDLAAWLDRHGRVP